jgi:hypothetical protein
MPNPFASVSKIHSQVKVHSGQIVVLFRREVVQLTAAEQKPSLEMPAMH